MLEIDDIQTYYGDIQVLWDITLHVDEGEIVAVVGANGAGKTTLLKTLLGLVEPDSGSIRFAGEELAGKASHEVAKRGLAYVPEGGRPFKDMSIQENLEMGAYVVKAWPLRKSTMKEVFDLFPRLEERKRQLARTLSGGERQMLAIGRALMSRPRLIMFDEPSIGLAPLLVMQFFEIIQLLRAQGITVLLIEQNVRQSLEIADRAYVLENGRITLEGTSEALLQEDLIRKAYLGL
jgi:branched-chain amino acid transport system ATP-binding protein